MIVKQVRLSNKAKERLSRIKGRTGIKNWNVLCRWALCYSLKEKTLPTDIEIEHDSNLEMSWYTFAGDNSEVYEALLISCQETLVKYFFLNLERGIQYLSATKFILSIDDLLELAVGG